MTRCAGARRAPYVMGADTPARHSARHAQARARPRQRRDCQARRRCALRDRAALSDDERKRLRCGRPDGAPAHVAGDYPEWLDPHFTRAFGDARAEEGAALSSRAPLDLRVNTLKADRDKAAAMLSDLKPEPARWSPWGLRIRSVRRRQKPGDPRRAGLHQGHGRSAGRGLATGRAVFRRQAGRAGGRSLRRRRRQDAGAWRR